MDDALGEEAPLPGAAATAAPAPPKAALVSTNPATATDIALSGAAPVTVGRDESVASAVLADPRVSAEQFVVSCRLAAAGGAWSYELEDRSRNGTLVSKRLVKGTKITLQDQDLVEVLPSSRVGQAAAITFLFQLDGAEGVAAPSPAKRRRTDEAAAAGGEAKAAATDDDIFEGAMCAICQEVLHRAASVQPCLHSFCSPCLGPWLRRPGPPSSVRCPLCRKQAVGVSRNTTMDGLIEGLLKARPERRRPPEVLRELEKNDPLQAVDYDLARLRGGGGAAAAAAAAPVAAAAVFGGGLFGGFGGFGGGGFGGGGGGDAAAGGEAHSDSEHGSESEDDEEEDEDEEEEARPPCFHCGARSWRPLGEAAATIAASAVEATQLAKSALCGNDFERGVLEEWLVARGGLGTALQAILGEPNPAGAAPLRVGLDRAPVAGAAAAAPGGGGGGGGGGFGGGGGGGGPPRHPAALPETGPWVPLDACRSCGLGVLREAVYTLRARIPAAELPARAQGRQDCWYGRACRTQNHRPTHAARLNHVCVQRRFG